MAFIKNTRVLGPEYGVSANIWMISLDVSSMNLPPSSVLRYSSDVRSRVFASVFIISYDINKNLTTCCNTPSRFFNASGILLHTASEKNTRAVSSSPSVVSGACVVVLFEARSTIGPGSFSLPGLSDEACGVRFLRGSI